MFSAEGRDFEHTAIAEIRPTEILVPDHSMKREVQTIQSSDRLGRRLPSGAAVLFRMPSDLEAVAQAQSEPDNEHTRFLPVADWLDDADHPSVIESYFSEVYYEQAKPRLRVHSFSVRHITDGTATDPRKEIGWLAKDDDVGRLQGLYAEIVSRADWEKLPDLAVMLSNIRSPRVFSRDASKKISETIPTCSLQGQLPYGIPERSGVFWHGTRWETCRAASPRFHSIRRSDGHLELARDDAGVIVAYRNVMMPENIGLKIAGQSFMASTDGRWHFDPATQLLVRIGKSYVQPASSTFERFFE